MDFTQLDNLLGALEKLQSLRPPSPPVVLNGHLGVWRTVRHNRMFIELLSGGKHGKVLVGPPSLVGLSLDNVPDDTWAAMTPRATLKEFKNVKVAENGVEALKDAIKNATGPKDTRRDALAGLNEPLQLVPMARRTGFTDEEIKRALAGDSPNNPLPKVSPKSKEDSVSRTSVIGKPVDSSKPDEKPDKPDEKPPAKGPDPAKAGSTTVAIDGALALLADPKPSDDETKNKDRARVVGERLDKIWPDIKEDLPARKIKSMAEGLKGGIYTLSEVAETLQEMRRSKEALTERNTPNEEQLDAMEDHNEVKDFIETFDTKVEAAVDKALEEKSQQFTGGGKEIVEEAKEDSQKLPKALEELIAENKRLKAESAKEAAKRLAEEKKAREKAKREQEQAARLRQEASAQRRAALEALSASQKEKLQIDAIIKLLNDLSSTIKSPKAKKEIETIVKQVNAGSYNRGHLLISLYRLLQLLLMLIPGI